MILARGWSAVGVVSAAIAALLLEGCLAHRDTGPVAARPIDTRADAVNPFDYLPGAIDVQITRRDDLSDYGVFSLDMPSAGANGHPQQRVTATYYRSNDSRVRPLVIVMPIWGSYVYPPRKLAKTLRRRSDGAMHVLVVDGDHFLFDWQGLADAATEEDFEALAFEMAARVRTVGVNMRRTLDWAVAQPEVDEAKVAVVGFSMSAVIAALVVAGDSRYRSAVFVMGGSRPAEIFAHCDGHPAEVRSAILARFGWDLERYRAVWQRVFENGDPASVTYRMPRENILMIDAERDQCMTAQARDDLWRALGEPRRMTFKYGHKKSFLAMTPLGLNFMDRKIYEFLRGGFDD